MHSRPKKRSHRTTRGNRRRARSLQAASSRPGRRTRQSTLKRRRRQKLREEDARRGKRAPDKKKTARGRTTGVKGERKKADVQRHGARAKKSGGGKPLTRRRKPGRGHRRQRRANAHRCEVKRLLAKQAARQQTKKAATKQAVSAPGSETKAKMAAERHQSSQ